MRIVNKGIKVLIVFVLMFSFGQYITIDAKSEYELVQYTIDGEIAKKLETFSDFTSANKKRRELGRKENYGILKNNKLIAVNYGVVDFGDTSENIDITNLNTNQKTYINQAYATDAAYLGTTDDESKVMFRLSGGSFSTDFEIKGKRITLQPYAEDMEISYYYIEGGSLKHSLSSGYVSLLGEAPSYLYENVKYYSYDGVYFYVNYRRMINDLIVDTVENAVNSDNPYYSYYLYLPYRSRTNYTAEDFANWFYKYNKYNKPYQNKISKFNTTEASFVESQETYGANGLLTYAIGRNESADGYSRIAQDKLNLFGHGAYDGSAYASAKSYSENSASIYDHAKKWMSQGYLNIDSFRFNGGHLGNKNSGLNVLYASDPYWGEKAASNYYKFDSAFGLRDYYKYRIGIVKDDVTLNFYTEPDYKNLVYSLKNKNDNSYIILDEIDNGTGKWYKVQSDVHLTENRQSYIRLNSYNGEYDFDNDYVYVKATEFKHIFGGSDKLSKNFTGYIGDVYYVNGEKADGKLQIDNIWYLFKKGVKYRGYYTENGVTQYYYNGKFATGFFDDKYFVNGLVGQGLINDGIQNIYLKDGLPYTGYATHNNEEYYFVEGLFANGTYLGKTFENGKIVNQPNSNNSSKVKNGYVDGIFYDNGQKANWWYDDGTAWYFFQNGKKHTGYAKDSNGEHFFDEGKYANWWNDDGTAWYFFQNGKKYTGYAKDNSGEHFFDEGKYANWWNDDGTAWYFFQNGKKYTGYAKDNSGEHFFDEGKYANWWNDDGTAWYFFQNGKKHTGYAKDNSGQHYFRNGRYAD